MRGPSRALRRSPRAWLAGALCLAIAVVVLADALQAVSLLRGSLEPGAAYNKDFGQDYLLARAVADGADPYVPMRELAARYLAPRGYLDKPYPSPHPPSVGVLFLPFLLLDYPDAVRAWFAIQAGCLVAGAGLAIRGAGLPIRQWWTPVLAFALLAWLPVVFDLGMGQLTIVLLALLAATQLALLRGRPALGGALLGLTLILKPLAWPWLLLLLWRRQWSAFVAALAMVAVGFVVPALRVGVGPAFSYLTQVLPAVSAFYATEPTNISLWTLGPRLFQATAPAAARLVGIAVPALVLALAVAWLRRRPPLGAALGVLTCVGILVNPLSWQYYFVLLVIPAAHVVEWLRAHRCPRVPTILAVGVAFALYLTGEDWLGLGRLAASPWIAADLPPAAASLLTLGPALAVGALGLLLAWLSPRTAFASVRRAAPEPREGRVSAPGQARLSRS